MEIKAVQELILGTAKERARFTADYEKSLRYYKTQNDITNKNRGKSEMNKDGKDEPLRHADNRVSSNFHQLLVNQEAGYVATVAPQIDVGSQADSDKVSAVLGDNFNLALNQLVIDAANAGLAWLHYWIDEDGNFRYGVIEPSQITPIWSTELNRKLLAVLRSYRQLDPDTGKYFNIHEYWTDKECQVYREVDNADRFELEPYNCFTSYDMTAGYETGQSNVYKHELGRVPFIAFPKNKYQQPDLLKYKGLIDAYDDIYNGFLNDLDDVQQVILVLTNFGKADLDQFMADLRKHSAIKFENDGLGDKSGVDKLTIDIPTEARDDALKITREDIFLYGQGVDPSKFESTNASGVAIKMLYSHLEMKAANTETHFRDAINELVRAIMNYLNLSNPEGRKITQTWTRTQVEDDLTQAQTIAQLANYTSKEAIAKNNPLVDDWQQELKDQKQDIAAGDPYASDDEHDKPGKLNGGPDDDKED
ncbi:phage portal protein [Lactobacillus sp. ESL0679]|uniref:phage portal protein n=1 Tax=Lactobacillus sp. ESL0679 TaxID=2983209 RepID=UPI0023F9323A|nr:phage portal protein [Lactobacillus sp. ESL0679]MDF7683402.1 phage portal protein [Lactobacillus sp. ESL0679]